MEQCKAAAVIVESSDAPWELQVSLVDEWSRRHGVCIDAWIYRPLCSAEGILEEVKATGVDTVIFYYRHAGRHICDRTRILSMLKRRFRVYIVN